MADVLKFDHNGQEYKLIVDLSNKEFRIKILYNDAPVNPQRSAELIRSFIANHGLLKILRSKPVRVFTLPLAMALSLAACNGSGSSSSDDADPVDPVINAIDSRSAILSVVDSLYPNAKKDGISNLFLPSGVILPERIVDNGLGANVAIELGENLDGSADTLGISDYNSNPVDSKGRGGVVYINQAFDTEDDAKQWITEQVEAVKNKPVFVSIENDGGTYDLRNESSVKLPIEVFNADNCGCEVVDSSGESVGPVNTQKGADNNVFTTDNLALLVSDDGTYHLDCEAMNGNGSNSQKNVIYFDLKSSENENPVFENVTISKLGGGEVETHAGLITDNQVIEFNYEVTDDLTPADDIEVKAYLNADGARLPLSKNAEGKFTVDTSNLGGLEVVIDLEATDSEGGRGTSKYSLGVIEANTAPVVPPFEITADQGVPALIFDGKYRDININLEVRFNALPSDERDGELSFSQIEVEYGVADDMRTAVVDENGVAVLENIDAFAGKEMTIRRVVADLDGLEASLSDQYGIHKNTPAYFVDEGDFDGSSETCNTSYCSIVIDTPNVKDAEDDPFSMRYSKNGVDAGELDNNGSLSVRRSSNGTDTYQAKIIQKGKTVDTSNIFRFTMDYTDDGGPGGGSS